MRIYKWVDMGQEVEIEIGADDIRLALAEAFAAVTTEDHKWIGGEVPNQNDVMKALNSIGAFLKALTDDQIDMLSEPALKICGSFLEEQSKRYSRAESLLKGEQ